MVSASGPSMSAYELHAWQALQDQAHRRERRKILKPETRQRISTGAHQVADKVRKVPGIQVAEETFTSALEGLRVVTMDAAMRSVSRKRVLVRINKHGPPLCTLSQIGTLDLERCDKAIPALRLRYATTAGAEGAMSSLAITGLEVATTVKGGPTAAAVAGAIAADTAVVLAAMGRVVAETGAYYGFDVGSSETEQLFALAIISYSSATSQPGKVAALAELSRLTQMMMRRATWETLSKEPLVMVIQRIYALLGLRLTKAGLAKAVPIAGALIGAGTNAASLSRISQDAKFAYRMRFLATKYQLDPAVMVRDVPVGDDDTIRVTPPAVSQAGP